MDDQQGGSGSARAVLIILAAALVMSGLLYYAYCYPYPGGHPPSWGSFVMGWLKELIILAFAFVVLIVAALAWVVRLLQGRPKAQ